jgi:hypothetical protein
VNKVLLTPGTSIPAPLFITWFQCVVTVAILWGLGEVGVGAAPGSFFAQFPRVTYDPVLARRLLPLAGVFVGMIAFNNLALKFVEVSFYNVARSLTIVFNVILTFFLLELGLLAARRWRVLRVVGWGLPIFGIVVPLLNAALALVLARLVHLAPGNAFLLMVLGASASYIAAPAALRHAIPKASSGLYVPMALAITFPFNIVFGLALYWAAVRWTWGLP